jgi:anti-sigma regulatory factor (Ser/Thr protein kinase)
MHCVLEADPTCLMRQITLPAQAESAGAARSVTRRTLAYWGLNQVTDEASLLVTELVANAVCHAQPGGPDGHRLVLSLTSAGSALRIEVRDADPRAPQPRVPGSLDESGFGLVIVDQLATRWGVYQSGAGKAVWAELPIEPGAQP